MFQHVVQPTGLRYLRWCCGALCILLGLGHGQGIWGADAEPTPESISSEQREAFQFFEQHVRPLLVTHCSECHSGDSPSGDLRLDSRATALAGGPSGPAIVPGSEDESLLLEAVRYESFEMPPSGPLADGEIEILRQWIADGAHWPADDQLPSPREADPRTFTEAELAYWAFQPIKRPEVPRLDDTTDGLNEIDHFIRARLISEGLEPAPTANKQALIRRVTYDLTGLPPTPTEVQQFLADTASDAYEQLVERLLDSPAYGERWARHWLDLVRYAESDGYRQDAYRPNAWRYRDYVIRAFNADMPYDRFVREQLAGDEFSPHDPWAHVATGLLRHGVYEYNQRDACTQRDVMFNEITDLVGEVFLGLGFGCARCHDHKFDPLLQDDYFRLQAFFAGMVPRDETPFATPEAWAEYREQQAAWETATAEIREQMDAIVGPRLAAAERGQVERFPANVQQMYWIAAEEKDSYQAQISDLVARQVRDAQARVESQLKEPELSAFNELKARLAEHKALRPEPPGTIRSVRDTSGTIAEVLVPKSLRPIAPGFPAILGDTAPTVVSDGAGRRSELARWLSRENHPLATRVIVNRVWHYHFQRGLVPSTSDFGRLGEPPSHPELLDWLACWFVDHGQSFKALHRLIVCSATYRQSAFHPAAVQAEELDPQNVLLWRAPVRRLAAEEIRDTLLTVTGKLDLQAGGPGVTPDKPRRSIYTRQIRNARNPLLAAYDGPEMSSSLPERSSTTTSLQALLLLNGSWMLDRAADLAQRTAAATDDPHQRIEQLYQLLFSRAATDSEREMALKFVQQQAEIIRRETVGWEQSLTRKPLPGREMPALYFPDDSNAEQIGFSGEQLVEARGLTVEAMIALESMYADSSVRVVAAQWNSVNTSPGWSLGVTSAKSAYKPRNVIVQLVGQNAAGKVTYEVVPSDVHLELNTPYYLSATLDFRSAEPSVTFRIRRLDNPEDPLIVKRVACTVVKDAIHSGPVVIGGRPGTGHHRWHGQMERVQIAARPLEADETTAFFAVQEGLVGSWDFSSDEPLSSIVQPGMDLRLASAGVFTPEQTAWQDLCQMLLASSELFYVD